MSRKVKSKFSLAKRNLRILERRYTKGVVSQSKFARVMREFKEGKLKTVSGQRVTERKQAVAIAFSEARKERKG
jgi:hypothetical protein